MFKFFLVLSLFLTYPLSAADFEGYPCTEDCSGHEAGYAWAEQDDITDPDNCGGNSNSFIEGCQAWAEDNTEDDESQDNSDDGD